MKTYDHKGYELTDRPLDWQDKLVLVACGLAAVFFIARVAGLV